MMKLVNTIVNQIQNYLLKEHKLSHPMIIFKRYKMNVLFILYGINSIIFL